HQQFTGGTPARKQPDSLRGDVVSFVSCACRVKQTKRRPCPMLVCKSTSERDPYDGRIAAELADLGIAETATPVVGDTEDPGDDPGAVEARLDALPELRGVCSQHAGVALQVPAAQAQLDRPFVTIVAPPRLRRRLAHQNDNGIRHLVITDGNGVAP